MDRKPKAPSDFDSGAILNFGGSIRPRLLIAEDDPFILHILKTMLLKKGFDLDCVVNGEQAMECLSRKKYDLILMDLQMPLKDGFEVSRAIRSQEEGTEEHVPIVALTAHAYKADRQKCLEAGMDAYMTKPFSFLELFLVLQNLLQKKIT